MKNRYIRQLAVVFFISLIIFLTYAIIIINQDLRDKSRLVDKVYELKIIDNNINTIIQQNTGYYNYDIPKDLIHKLDNLLDDIENDSTIENFLKDKKYKDIYEKVLEIFSHKKRFMHVFMATNSRLNHSLRFITTLITEMPAIRYQKELIKLHSILVQIGVGADATYSQMEELLRKLSVQLEEKYIYDLDLYVKHSKVVLENFKRLDSLKVANANLKFDEKLSTFIEHMQIYLDEQVKALNFYLRVIALLLFLLVLGSIFLLNLKIQQEAKLKTFKEAVEKSDNFILITNHEHKIEYANEALLKSVGYSFDEIEGKTPAIMQSGLHTQEFYAQLSSTISKGKKWSGEFINKDNRGNLLYEKASITPIFDEDGKISQFMAIKLDITADKLHQQEIEEKNKEIEKRFYTDYLTGLGNRNLLSKYLYNHEYGRLYYININDFTQLKTFYGMKNSDAVIQKLAEGLMSLKENVECFKALFRVKSDEFCLWCSYDKYKPIELMEIIYDTIFKMQFFIDGTLIKLDITIGASKSTDGKNENRYIESEIAHHNARSKNLNFMVYEDNNIIENRYKENIHTLQLIQNAIDEDRIVVYFQPIFDAKTKKVYMYESLVRLVTPSYEVLTPAAFLETAKMTKYYNEIMHIVIKKTFEKSNQNPDLKFSINFSNIDFSNELTQDILLQELSKAKSAQNIAVEILESETILDYAYIKETIGKIKKFGYQICIDDFGSGHSNYFRLSQLEVDYIKIDGSIIKDLDSNSYSLAVLETIMTFAKKMNYPVVAEFVHSKRILEIVEKYDVDYIQGFYLGKPEEKLLEI